MFRAILILFLIALLLSTRIKLHTLVYNNSIKVYFKFAHFYIHFPHKMYINLISKNKNSKNKTSKFTFNIFPYTYIESFYVAKYANNLMFSPISNGLFLILSYNGIRILQSLSKYVYNTEVRVEDNMCSGFRYYMETSTYLFYIVFVFIKNIFKRD